MRSAHLAVVILGAATLAAAAAAGTLVTPGKALVQPAPVTPLALTGRAIAFGVGVSPSVCRVKLWSLAKRSVTTFGLPRLPTCTVETSTGSGIAAVSVASGRVAWLAYTGGNTREWSLFTAAIDSPKPMRLRFASRDVDGPAPIVLGAGTPQGIPYAVNREIVYLGDDGTRLFRTVASHDVRLIAAGPGPAGVRVVALTAAERIVALAADGRRAADDIVPAGAVKALCLVAAGIAYQVGSLVHVVGPAGEAQVTLPAGATMVDAAAGQILYQRAGDLGAVSISGGAARLLLDGTRADPVVGRLEAAGLAWARGATVSWHPGPLPSG